MASETPTADDAALVAAETASFQGASAGAADRPHPDGPAAADAAVVAMQERFGPELVSAGVARRFLVARNWDNEAAGAMLEASLAWRAETFPIDFEGCRAEAVKGKLFVRGVDRQGHRVLQVQAARGDPRVRDLEKAKDATIWMVEHCVQQLAADPQAPQQLTMLLSRQGSSRSTMDIPLFKELARTFEANYPETLAKIVIYPVNWLFWLAWKVIKQFLDPRTAAKMVLARNEAEVQEHVAAEWVPEDIGGTMRIPTGEEVVAEIEATEQHRAGSISRMDS